MNTHIVSPSTASKASASPALTVTSSDTPPTAAKLVSKSSAPEKSDSEKEQEKKDLVNLKRKIKRREMVKEQKKQRIIEEEEAAGLAKYQKIRRKKPAEEFYPPSVTCIKEHEQVVPSSCPIENVHVGELEVKYASHIWELMLTHVKEHAALVNKHGIGKVQTEESDALHFCVNGGTTAFAGTAHLHRKPEWVRKMIQAIRPKKKQPSLFMPGPHPYSKNEESGNRRILDQLLSTNSSGHVLRLLQFLEEKLKCVDPYVKV